MVAESGSSPLEEEELARSLARVTPPPPLLPANQITNVGHHLLTLVMTNYNCHTSSVAPKTIEADRSVKLWFWTHIKRGSLAAHRPIQALCCVSKWRANQSGVNSHQSDNWRPLTTGRLAHNEESVCALAGEGQGGAKRARNTIWVMILRKELRLSSLFVSPLLVCRCFVVWLSCECGFFGESAWCCCSSSRCCNGRRATGAHG